MSDSTTVTMRIQRLFRGDISDGMIMTLAMVAAGGFDYLTNIMAGRLLGDEIQFGIFVAVAALIQIMVQVTNVIRNVVAFYSAELQAKPSPLAHVGAFYRRAWRWAWLWGALATLLIAALSPIIGRLIDVPTAPLIAASLAVLMLFVRPVTDGTLQGVQHFFGLASVQLSQSIIRFVSAIVLIALGWQAFGAVLALPIATASACVLAVWFLRDYRGAPAATRPPTSVSRGYTLFTLLGLGAFAVMVNADAIIVARDVSGGYAPLVTLGKVNLFVALALGMVLFPKVVDRATRGEDARSLLLLALGVSILGGVTLSIPYFFFGDWIITTIFEQPLVGRWLLGLIGIGTTLFACVNIWVNYALSLERNRFLQALALLAAIYIPVLIWQRHDVAGIITSMIIVGVIANLMGVFMMVRTHVETPRRGASTPPDDDR